MKLILTLFLVLILSSPVLADETATFTTALQPNVLLILDNSNSMDQDFYGNAVSSWRESSRSAQARKSVIDFVINPYYNTVRFGLMTYRVSNASKYHLHMADYFRSYNPASYCPLGTSEEDKNCKASCERYCVTASETDRSACQTCCQSRNPLFNAVTALTLDEMFSAPGNVHYPANSTQRERYCKVVFPRTQRMPNPVDTANYYYYKTPGTLYSSSSFGNRFCYADPYSAQEANPPNYTSPIDTYRCYTQKRGQSDGGYLGANPGQYGGTFNTWSFIPTDEDFALGFMGEFGRRLGWTYSGRTWFRNSSPGGGHLHVPCADGTVAHINNLLAKLNPFINDETGYMACNNTGNVENCPYIVNAGLTPTAGTLQSAINYFRNGIPPPSPIQYWCQNNFIIYITDGLPSVAENGNPGTAEALMPAVLNKLTTLRNIQRTVDGQLRSFDIRTYILGVGMTDTAKAFLDQMAVRGGTDVDGKAYYADDPAQLQTSLAEIIADIIERRNSFTSSSVKSNRVADENHLFAASFEPRGNSAFWPGQLRRFTLQADGSVPTDYDWDAQEELSTRAGSDRTIFTYLTSKESFIESNTSITNAMLGVSTAAERTALFNFIRNGTPPDYKKLGDIFHSDIVTISSPNVYFKDHIDLNNAYETFRSGKQRTGDNKIVVAGANDGQLHAFGADTGKEIWSFIPPNLLPKLKLLKDGSQHQFYVDGPLTAADVWLGSGSGQNKSPSDWKTLLIVGLGKGVNEEGICVNDCSQCPAGGGYYCYKHDVCSVNKVLCRDVQDKCVRPSYLWSSSPTCSSGFSHSYSGTHSHYCGYYALDITATHNPQLRWKLNVTPSEAPYLGEPWSKMSIGRVKVGGNEKWVGFIGGGYNPNGSADPRGKGFFVIDLSNGNILKSFTTGFTHSIPAQPTIVDLDNDGFIDTAYVGDLGGNVWRFTFCKAKSPSTCSYGQWQSSKLYHAGSGQPIYTRIAVTMDKSSNIWLYWVTGDKTDPFKSGLNRIYGIKEDTPSQSATFQFTNLTSSLPPAPNARGWYIELGTNEKGVGDILVFAGYIYVTTYVPPSSCANPCEIAGKSYLNIYNYETLSLHSRIDLGPSVSPTPVISIKPPQAEGSQPHYYRGDIYGMTTGAPGRIGEPPGMPDIQSNIILWRDRRAQ